MTGDEEQKLGSEKRWKLGLRWRAEEAMRYEVLLKNLLEVCDLSSEGNLERGLS